jgi:hypothetical protein
MPDIVNDYIMPTSTVAPEFDFNSLDPFQPVPAVDLIDRQHPDFEHTHIAPVFPSLGRTDFFDFDTGIMQDILDPFDIFGVTEGMPEITW